jgi:ribbon-helix-helix CopG family protein
MRRVQIHLDEELDRAAAAEGARRGVSKAALIRASLAKELDASSPDPEAAWAAMTGWLQDGGVDDIDAVAHGRGDQTGRP